MTSMIAKPLLSGRSSSRLKLQKIRKDVVCNSHQIDVEFVSDLSTNQLITMIDQIPKPNVITWYIGYRGLRSAGVQFYRDFLISPILMKHNEATFWLVDLTAWSAFKNPKCSIRNFNRACEVIENISHRQIRCIKSADIFAKMQELSEKETIKYFKKALLRDFISFPSKHFLDNNIRTRDIFSGSCPIIADWYGCDASKSYSVLQYLEGCFLVEKVFTQQIANGENDIKIVFALPNDEIKYYKDRHNSFQNDIAFLISRYCATLNLKSIRLNVKFLAFKYGTTPNDRPYNASGKVIKNGMLSYLDIIGESVNIKLKSNTDPIHAFNI